MREKYCEALDALGLFDDRSPLNTPGVLDAVRTSTPHDAVGRDGPDPIDVPIETDEPFTLAVADYESKIELP